jgi:hypothetical protein
MQESTKQFTNEVSIKTRAGNMIMITGWVSHHTTPSPEEKPRITLGFDISSVSEVKNAEIPFDSGKEFHI